MCKHVYRQNGFGLYFRYFEAYPKDMDAWYKRSWWDRFWHRSQAPWSKL